MSNSNENCYIVYNILLLVQLVNRGLAGNQRYSLYLIPAENHSKLMNNKQQNKYLIERFNCLQVVAIIVTNHVYHIVMLKERLQLKL